MNQQSSTVNFEQGAFLDAVDVAFLRLASDDANVRKLGAQSLAELLPAGKVKTIQVCLAAEQHPNTAKWLALALGRIGDPSSLPMLLAALTRIEDPDARDWLQHAIDTVRGLNTAERMRSLLGSTDPEAALGAARIAWNRDDLSRRDVQRLLRLLDHSDPHVRRWAILALGSTGQLEEPAPFHDALSDSDFRVREWSEWAIAQAADDASFTHLINHISDEHPRVREWAIKALAALSVADIPHVITQYYRTELDPLCREAAVLSIAAWADDREVREFVAQVIENELHPIVIAAITRLVLTTVLKDDPAIVNQLVERVRCSDIGLLVHELESYLYAALTDTEKQAAKVVKTSPTLPFLFILGAHRATKRQRRKVAFVIALPEEFREFRRILAEMGTDAAPVAGTDSYYEFNVPGMAPDNTAVAALVGDVGPIRAGLVTQDLMARFTLDTVVSLGIAAAIHEDLMIGDVAIGRQVDDYMHSAKAVPGEDGFELNLSGDPFKTDASLLRQAINLEFVDADGYAKWQQRGIDELRAALPDAYDLLVSTGVVRAPALVEPANIASSSITAGAQAFNAWLQKHDRNYKAVDMEASGVALSVHFRGLPVRTLVVRGISDYGDVRKKDFDRLGDGALRRWAMGNAVRWLLVFLPHCGTQKV